jgi:4-amino-4-deoxy-L-arabinose transferase-like glycosyltransferase
MPATSRRISRLGSGHPDAALAAAIFGVALGARLAFASQAPVLFAGDSTSYLVAAGGLAHGSLAIPLHRAVGYPLFLAVVDRLAGEGSSAIMLAQHLLGSLTAALVYLLASVGFGRPAGLVAGLLIVLSAPLIVFERYVMAETLFTALLTLAFWLVLAGQRRSVVLLPLAAGLTLGLAAVVRPVALALAPAALLALLLGPRSWRERRHQLEVFALGLLLVSTPLLIWNRTRSADAESVVGTHLYGRVVVHDALLLPAPDSPPSAGLSPRLAAARLIILESATRAEPPSEVRLRLRAVGFAEAEANLAMRLVVTEIIAAQPARYLAGTLERMLMLLRGTPEEVPTGNPYPLLQPADHSVPIAILVLAGLARSATSPSRRPLLALGLAALSLCLISAALVGFVPRYRYPVDPLLAVLTAAGFATCLGRLAAGTRRLSSALRPNSARVPV